MTKYGDKIYTYKDIEEAKKLIGKNVIGSDFLGNLEYENPTGSIFVTEGKLYTIKNNDAEPFIVNGDYCQFIREIIEEEPKYRPFKDVNELIENWEKKYGNKNRPNETMPLIWVKSKSTGNKLLVTVFYTLEVGNGEDIYSMKQLLDNFTFLDGSPCGVEVEE